MSISRNNVTPAVFICLSVLVLFVTACSGQSERTDGKAVPREFSNAVNGISEREEILEPYITANWPEPLYEFGSKEAAEIVKRKGWYGGTRHFDNLPLTEVKKLVSNYLLKLDEKQNEAPTTAEFIKFMEKWEKYDIRAQGYEISKMREDARVTLDGLMTPYLKEVTDEEFLADWRGFNKGANELSDTYSWWD